MRFLPYLSILFLFALHSKLSAQVTTVEQPYNRFQYHTFRWQVFHTRSFHIYYPKGYDSLGAYIARQYTGTQALIKKRMGTALQKEPNIILYPSADQLYETNIGSFEVRSYTLPTIMLKGERIVLAFTGSYTALQQQLRRAMVRAVWEETFREDLGEQVKAVIAERRLPYWFTEGMMEYFSDSWPVEAEDKLGQSFREKNFPDWQAVIAYEPRLAGQALCYFLSQHYYNAAPLQLYQQVRRKKSLPRAIRLITKKNEDSLYHQCWQFYADRFSLSQNSIAASARHMTIPHEKGLVRTILPSGDPDLIAYIVSGFHTRTVWIYDHSRQKASKLITYQLPPWMSYHIADSYPLMAWNQQGNLLSVLLPEKGKIHLKQFDASGRMMEEHTLYGTDGVHAMQPAGNTELLLSAFRKGQTDIVSYHTRKEKYTALTDDPIDDLDFTATDNKNLLYFLSQRDHLVKTADGRDSAYKEHGIFRLQGKKISPFLTDTIVYKQWGQPYLLPDGRLLTTTTQNGTEQFALVTSAGEVTILDKVQPFSISNNNSYFFHCDADSIYINEQNLESGMMSNTSGDPAIAPWLKDYHHNEHLIRQEDSLLRMAKDTEPSFLEGVFKTQKEHGQKSKDSLERSLQFDTRKVKPYILQLHSAYFTARINNDYLINRYQPYVNYQGQFKFPEAGGMADGGFTDLFEDHHFSIAYRMPAGSEGSDFRVRYENTRRKTDWGIGWFRKVESLQPDPKRNWVDEHGNPYPNAAKVKTNYGELFLHIPVTYYLGIDFNTALRFDRTVFLATDHYPLTYPDIKSTWSISALSATLNRLRPTLGPLYKGVKASIQLDAFKGLSHAKATLYGAGIDLQYHQPVYRYITAVGRLQTGYSGGDAKVLYNMGGVDNNLSIRTDSSVHFSQAAPYAFQTLVTPLRGFKQNTLYGNQYLLFNLDIYFPLFESLIPIETPLPSLNQLQLGLFADMAETQETWRRNVTANWKSSVGFSARTYLAGYPIRFDMGFPDGFREKPIWYLSLSLR